MSYSKKNCATYDQNICRFSCKVRVIPFILMEFPVTKRDVGK